MTNGNLTSDGTRTFEWDARNQLLAVTVGTHRSEFTYNGEQQRVRIVEKESGVTQSEAKVVWCGGSICEDRAADGTTIDRRRFSHGEQAAGVANYFVKDHLLSVRAETNNSGSLLASVSFDPWGRRTGDIGTTAMGGRYTGHSYQSNSGLWLAWRRGYDAEIFRIRQSWKSR